MLGRSAALLFFASALISAPTAFSQSGEASSQEYTAALAATSSALSSDMVRSHQCFLRAAYYAVAFASGAGEETDRINRRLYGTVADAFRQRINWLISLDHPVPDEFAWAIAAIYDQEPKAQKAAGDWYKKEMAGGDFDQKAKDCFKEMLEAAGPANFQILQRDARLPGNQ